MSLHANCLSFLGSLPDLPEELLDCIFENTCLVDRIRIAQVWPLRMQKHTLDYFSRAHGHFKVSYRQFLLHTGQHQLNEEEFVQAIHVIIPFLGRFITDLCINYNFQGMPAVPPLISQAVRAYCRYLIRFQIIDIAQYWGIPNVLLVPDMTTVESFVFSDSSFSFNHDKIIEQYLAECCGRIESLSINRSCLDGSCLRNLYNLRYLRLRSNLRVRVLLNDNEEPQPEISNLSISDINEYCRISPVRHLDLMQHEALVEDAVAILSMGHLSHLTMTIEHSTTSECVSEFLKELFRGDKIENLNLTAFDKGEYEINQGALDVLETVTRLQQVHLKGFLVNAPLLHTLSQLHANNVLKTFTLK